MLADFFELLLNRPTSHGSRSIGDGEGEKVIEPSAPPNDNEAESGGAKGFKVGNGEETDLNVSERLDPKPLLSPAEPSELYDKRSWKLINGLLLIDEYASFFSEGQIPPSLLPKDNVGTLDEDPGPL